MSEKAFPLADAELTIALQDLVQVRVSIFQPTKQGSGSGNSPQHKLSSTLITTLTPCFFSKQKLPFTVTASLQLQANQKGCQRSYQNAQSWYFRAHHHGCRCGTHWNPVAFASSVRRQERALRVCTQVCSPCMFVHSMVLSLTPSCLTQTALDLLFDSDISSTTNPHNQQQNRPGTCVWRLSPGYFVFHHDQWSFTTQTNYWCHETQNWTIAHLGGLGICATRHISSSSQ